MAHRRGRAAARCAAREGSGVVSFRRPALPSRQADATKPAPVSQRRRRSAARISMSAAEADAAVGRIASGCKLRRRSPLTISWAIVSSVPGRAGLSRRVRRRLAACRWRERHDARAARRVATRLPLAVRRACIGSTCTMLAARPRVPYRLDRVVCAVSVSPSSLTAMVIGWARLRSEVKRP